MEILKHIAPNITLHPTQVQGVMMALKHKRVLLGHDTGMGKSYMYSVLVRALVNAEPESKHVLVMISDSIKQLPRDIADIAQVPVGVVDATQLSKQYFYNLFKENTVICMTYESFRVHEVVLLLYALIGEVSSFSIDEAHHASNWDTSDTAFTLRAFSQYPEYCIGLTATPMTVKSQQFYRLMNLIDNSLSYRRDETTYGKYIERYLPTNRVDNGLKGNYTPTLVAVNPQLEQLGKQHGIVFNAIKGKGAVNQVQSLITVLQERIAQGKRCIVYIQYHETREWVEQNLKEANISYTAVHGKIKSRELRDKRCGLFRDGTVQVMLTSISESLNLDADVVVFYEFNASMKQIVGRAHRGLRPKNLEVVLIITKDTEEVDFFLDAVDARAREASRLLHKDYSEVLALGEQIKQMRLEDD